MAVTASSYFQFVSTGAATTWNGTNGDPGTWLLVIQGASGGLISNMGDGDPGAGFGWPPGSWQLLAQADAGQGLPKLRVWAMRFIDTVSRSFRVGDDTPGIDVHSHVYFLHGVRPGLDAAEVFSVGANDSTNAGVGASQQVPTYSPDADGLLIGAWISGAVANYSSLGGLTARAEVDGASSTSRTGEETLSAAGPSSLTASSSVAAAWAAVSIAVRPDAGASVTFSQEPLVLKTEAAFGANPNRDPAYWAGLWTDISDDARSAATIERGRADEASTVQPSSLTLKLDNTAGRYVRQNPYGPYYGLLSKNTPLRHWVDAGDGPRLRYTGFVSEWPPRSQGGEVDENMPVRADGATRRLSRAKGLNSPLYRAILARGGLSGYWPLETDFSSALGGAAMRTKGEFTFGDGGPPGSAGAVSTTKNAIATTSLVGMPDLDGWAVSFWLDIPEDFDTANDTSIMVTWTTPGSRVSNWVCYMNPSSPGTIIVGAFTVGEQALAATFTDLVAAGAGPYLITCIAFPNGSDVSFGAWVNTIDGSVSEQTGSSISGDVVSPITNVGINTQVDLATGTSKGSVSHLMALAAADPTDHSVGLWGSATWIRVAGSGYAGEIAADRLRRISAEENFPVVIVGDDGTSTPMGPQPTARFLDILQDCETADGGVLYERRDGRLGYQIRSARYNATPALTIDYAAGDLAPPLEPTDDDQHSLNDYTSSRDGGGSYRVIDQTHKDTVGEYASSGTVNVADDTQLPDDAGWRVHLGTADGLRYPSLTPNLNGRPALIPAWADLDVGQAIAVTNPGRDLPPGTINVFAEGYTETIDTVSWTATANASPGDPWDVIVLDDDTLARLDTAGSALAADVTETATSISVASVDGPAWTTSAADMPLDILVGGEQMTVTAVALYATDTFARTVSNGWGTADTGQTWTALVSPAPASDYSVSSGLGKHSLSAVNQHMFTTIPMTGGYFDIRADLATDRLAVGGDIILYLVGRFTDVNNYYMANVGFSTNQAVSLTIRRAVAGTETHLAGGIVSGLRHAANTRFQVRFKGDGPLLRAKIWTGLIEPDGWDVTVTDTALTTGAVGMRSLATGGYSGTLPVVASYDNVQVHPQTMTVTRAVNGVSKTHTAGEDVRLATPPTLSY
jgi:hypothetical protein